MNGAFVFQGDLDEQEREEIECAIALSLSEQDLKGKRVVGMLHFTWLQEYWTFSIYSNVDQRRFS